MLSQKMICRHESFHPAFGGLRPGLSRVSRANNQRCPLVRITALYEHSKLRAEGGHPAHSVSRVSKLNAFNP